MRWFSVFFVLAIFPLVAGEAGQEALGLMQSLRDRAGNPQVMERLGISPYCGPRKMAVIKSHWAVRANWADEGQYAFQLIDEKVDGDLGAVLIGGINPNSPFSYEVIPLALVRDGGKWRVGPLEGSFENTALGFDPEVTQRTANLERWMARERIGAASALRVAQWEEFRQAVQGAVPEEELRSAGPQEALAHFLKAAETGDIEATILWQGFLERDEDPQVDWERNLRVTRLGMKGEDKQEVWRLLTSRKVMRVVMDDEIADGDGSQEILVGFLSAFKAGTMNDRLNPVRFELTKTSSGWRVKLPIFFAFADEERDTFRDARNRAIQWQDRDGVRRMFKVFESKHKKIREEEARTIVEGVAKDLQEGDLETYLRRLYRFAEDKPAEDDAEGEQEEKDDVEEQAQRLLQLQRGRLGRRGNDEADQEREKIYESAVKWWDLAHENREMTRVETSKLFLKDKIGLAILSLPSSPDSWEPRYLELWLGLGSDGWKVLPGHERPVAKSYPESEKEEVADLIQQFKNFQEKANEDFLKNVLEVVELDAGEGKPGSQEEAYRAVREWREAAKTGGMMALLKSSAVRKKPETSKGLLKRLGYVRKNAAAATLPDQFLGSRVSGRYHAVSLMIDRGVGSIRKCPLLIVVPTTAGYRVLVDIELPLATNSGLSMMNQELLEDLAKEMPEEDFARIKEIQKWHQETAGPVWEKWDQERKLQEN